MNVKKLKPAIIGGALAASFLVGNLTGSVNVLGAESVAALKKQIVALNKQIATLKENSIKNNNTKVKRYGKELANNYNDLGTTVPSVIEYKGVQFIPAGLAAQIYNDKATYIGKENTLYIGGKNNNIYLSDLEPYFSKQSYSNNTSETSGSLKFNKNVVFSYDFYSFGGSKHIYNLEGKYTKLITSLGLVDVSQQMTKQPIQIYGDDVLLFETTLNIGDLPSNIEIDVTKVRKLQIVLPVGESSSYNIYRSGVIFGDAKLIAE